MKRNSNKLYKEVKMNKSTTVLISALVGLICLLLGAFMFSTHEVETKYLVQTEYLPISVAVPVADNTTLEVRNYLLEDKDFEKVAYNLAEAELTDDEYEDLFDFMVANEIAIVDKEDISKVLITEDDYSNVDGEDKDADVTFELKVYYEDSDGDDKKTYIDADFEVLDNEVENIVFALH